VDHPCQTLADLMTIRECAGGTCRLKIAVSWAYAPSYAKPSPSRRASSCCCRASAWTWCWRFRRVPPHARDHAGRAGERPCARRQVPLGGRHGRSLPDADLVIPKSWGCLDTMGSPRGVAAHRQAVYKLDLRTRGDGRSPSGMPSTCTRSPPTAARSHDEVIDGPRSVGSPKRDRLHTPGHHGCTWRTPNRIRGLTVPETLVIALGGKFHHAARRAGDNPPAVPPHRRKRSTNLLPLYARRFWHRPYPRQRPADRQHPDPQRGSANGRCRACRSYTCVSDSQGAWAT